MAVTHLAEASLTPIRLAGYSLIIHELLRAAGCCVYNGSTLTTLTPRRQAWYAACTASIPIWISDCCTAKADNACPCWSPRPLHGVDVGVGFWARYVGTRSMPSRSVVSPSHPHLALRMSWHTEIRTPHRCTSTCSRQSSASILEALTFTLPERQTPYNRHRYSTPPSPPIM
jgi:hypothetical protein